MPELSRFYGVIIRMFYDDHPPPHFHAVYQDKEVQVNIETLEIMKGGFRVARCRSCWSGPLCIVPSWNVPGSWPAETGSLLKSSRWSKITS